MQRYNSPLSISMLALCAGVLAANVALADKPNWKEGAKHQQKKEKVKLHSGKEQDYRGQAEAAPTHQSANAAIRQGEHFKDRQRIAIHDYYTGQFRTGHCPPGLAKKHNGCQPPGKARKWKQGLPLPRDVIYYDLPPSIVAVIGQPPRGYRYVRVASDILMIAVGTGLVIDAILDLGSM